MPERLWNRFLASPGQSDDEDDDSGFVPSVLDWSVRHGHGSGEEQVSRELARVDARARELDEADRRH